MTKYGVDMTMPPSPEQAQRMADLGWRYCGVYVGGPRAAAHDAWQNGPVGTLAPIFDGFFAFYVCRNTPWDDASIIGQSAEADAMNAAADMGACGFDGNQPMIVDLEYGTYRASPDTVRQYFLAFNSRTKTYNPNRKIILYSDEESCAALADIFDGVMIAWWSQSALNQTDWQAPIGEYDPNKPPSSDAWQFGGGSIAGVAVDYDSFVDDFPFAVYVGG